MTMNNFKIFFNLALLTLGSVSINPCQASQVLPLSENRVDVVISPDSMNRIAVVNDRIAQVFGDEGTFVSQADEHTGQVFIKPSPENGTKPLSITFITENGLTQDLTLKPTASRATTSIFKNTSPQASVKTLSSSMSMGSLDSPLEKSLPIQEQLLAVMRHLISGQLGEREGESSTRLNPEGYHLEYQKAYQSGSYVAYVFLVQNITSTAIELLEKSFYQPGDLALSFQKRVLMPGEKTQFFVVRRS
jgi:type-F conjugative transfer system secretin TraK